MSGCPVGYGGQLIVVVPELDAVLVMTALSDVTVSESDLNIGIEREFLAKLVVPALQGG